jgi:hypothetical protein
MYGNQGYYNIIQTYGKINHNDNHIFLYAVAHLLMLSKGDNIFL